MFLHVNTVRSYRCVAVLHRSIFWTENPARNKVVHSSLRSNSASDSDAESVAIGSGSTNTTTTTSKHEYKSNIRGRDKACQPFLTLRVMPLKRPSSFAQLSCISKIHERVVSGKPFAVTCKTHHHVVEFQRSLLKVI